MVCGGKQNNIISFSLQESTTSKVMCDLWPSVSKRISLCGTAYLRNIFFNHERKSSESIQPDSLYAYKHHLALGIYTDLREKP